MSYFPGEDKLDAAIDAATANYGLAGEVYGKALKIGIGLTGGAIVAEAAPLLAAAVSSTLLEAGAAIGGTAAGVASGVLAGSATAAGAGVATGAGIAAAVAPYAVPVVVVVAAVAGIVAAAVEASAKVQRAYDSAVRQCILPDPDGSRVLPIATGAKQKDGSRVLRPVDVLIRADGTPTSIGEALRAIETARLQRKTKTNFFSSPANESQLQASDVLTEEDRSTLRTLREAIESDRSSASSSKALLFPLYLSTLATLRKRGLTNSAMTQAWLLARGMRPELAATLADPRDATPSWKTWIEIAAPSRFPRSNSWAASAVRIGWPEAFGDSWCWWADLIVPAVTPQTTGLPFGVQGAATIIDDWQKKTAKLDDADPNQVRRAIALPPKPVSSWKADASRRKVAQRRRVVVAGGSALLLTGAAFLLRSRAWRSILSRATAT